MTTKKAVRNAPTKDDVHEQREDNQPAEGMLGEGESSGRSNAPAVDPRPPREPQSPPKR